MQYASEKRMRFESLPSWWTTAAPRYPLREYFDPENVAPKEVAGCINWGKVRRCVVCACYEEGNPYGLTRFLNGNPYSGSPQP